VIRSFRSKSLERFWWKGEAKRVDARHRQRLRRQLGLLDVAKAAEDMNIPGWRFHVLTGRDAGRFSVWIDQNWRLTFGWSDDGPDAVEVDYEDYH
jgi:proteic killer suppression protein